MKQVVETSEIKKKIEQLIKSAQRDYKRGDIHFYDKKIDAVVIFFDLLEDLVCEPETWEDDMFRLNEWKDSLRG